jgi:hypothetical protein
MFRKGWITVLTCAALVSLLLYGLDVIPGAVAWCLLLGFASLIVASLVLREQTPWRSAKSPINLLQDYSPGAAQEQADVTTIRVKAGESASRILNN